MKLWVPQSLQLLQGWSFSPGRQLFEALQGVRVAPHKKDHGGGLRIRFGAALLPLFEGSFVDPQLACEHGSRPAQFFSRVPNQFRVHLRKRLWSYRVAAQREFAFAVPFHGSDAFDQLTKNFPFAHYRVLRDFFSLQTCLARRTRRSGSMTLNGSKARLYGTNHIVRYWRILLRVAHGRISICLREIFRIQ